MLRQVQLFILLLSLLPLHAYARNYSVEAIVFSHVVSPGAAVVAWDANAPRNIRAQTRLERLYREADAAQQAREQARRADPGNRAVKDDDTQTIETVVVDELAELQTIHDRLVQSPEHEILQVLSWQQSEAGYQASPMIPVTAPQLKGVLRIYAPNLLYAEANLVYAPGGYLPGETTPDSETIQAPTALPTATRIPDPRFASFSFDRDGSSPAVARPIQERYFLDEQRKLKLNEIHYFDHPRFGVILMVRPLDEQKPAAAAQD